MADEADIANERAEQMLAASLVEAAHQLQAQKAKPFTGRCEYCGDPVADLVRYCGEDCRDDSAWRQESLRRRGLA